MKARRKGTAMRRDEARAAYTKFPLGEIVLTVAAHEWLRPEEIEGALARHAQGDWADLHREDWPLSDMALVTGDPVVSVHTTADGIRFWVITEGDRQATTVMLAERYEEACAGRPRRAA